MTAAAFPAGRPRHLAFLPKFLFSAAEPKLGYVVKAWLLALVPSLALALAVTVAVGGAEPPPDEMRDPRFIFLVVAVSPPLETLLMIPPLWALEQRLGATRAVVGSALIWAALHSLASPLWGLVVWWPFLILSTALLTWRQRGIARAVLLVTAIHVLQNAVAAALPLVLTRVASG
ncbi:MAG: hypothetical protein M3177_07260 [Pseudomonadota bacterium]|nr:hypothetical protein [Pseudomonadota bacterium]